MGRHLAVLDLGSGGNFFSQVAIFFKNNGGRFANIAGADKKIYFDLIFPGYRPGNIIIIGIAVVKGDQDRSLF